MKQGEHGGSLSRGKRRSKRPLSTKHSLHVTLRSELARGSRNLLRHRRLIDQVIARAASRFRIRVYENAIVSNHIHFLIRGYSREQIQNFFRVVAGHIAQGILREFPLKHSEAGGASIGSKRGGNPPTGCEKNQRKFWDLLIYSRMVSWGREFATVSRYIVQNTLEALNLMVYRTRTHRSRSEKGNTS